MNEGLKSKVKYLEFWQDKEIEFNAKLIIQSYAVLKPAYNDSKKPFVGLLFLMTDGLHFEDFPKRKLIFKNKNYKKTKIAIGKDNIIKITDYKNRIPSKKKRNLVYRILSGFSTKDYVTIIHFKDAKTKKYNKYEFETLIRNYIWHEKFSELINKTL